MFPKSFSDFTFYQKKKDILIYKAADSNHQYILKCSENTTPALKQALMNMRDYPLCPIHLSQSIMGSARISHYQNQILLSLRFVWSAVMAAYCLNSYHFWL